MADSSNFSSVLAVYPSRTQAASAVDALIVAGFVTEDISVVLADEQSSHAFAEEQHTTDPEQPSVPAAAVGNFVGDTLEFIAGMGALVVPDFGPLIAAGPMVATLTADGASGGVAGALAKMGVPDADSRDYHDRIKAGGVLLSVHCDDTNEAVRAEAALRIEGADVVAFSGAKMSAVN